jgi:hypothetical protein
VGARAFDDPLEPEVGTSGALLENSNDDVTFLVRVSVLLLLVETKVNRVVRVAVPDALVVALATMEALPYGSVGAAQAPQAAAVVFSAIEANPYGPVGGLQY